jgi:N-succinyldiaminopimelate aminotransferase
MHGIGVDKMGNVGDKQKSNSTGDDSVASSKDLLRLENLDVDIPPDDVVQEITSQSAAHDDDNSYLPFLGQLQLRSIAAKHVSTMTGNKITYDGEKNCIISTGGLSGILNVLLATVENGDGVLLLEPVYAGLLNRVHLAGGIPYLAPFTMHQGESWTLDHDKLRQVVVDPKAKITTMLLMSPCMPTGAYLTQKDWQLITDLSIKHDLLLIYDAAMERLLYDNLPVVHPASFPGMEDRTITVGSASKELRMIGWRVGWIVGPKHLMGDIGLVSMANVVVPVGIAQRAAAKALETSRTTIKPFIQELQKRKDLIMQELEGLPYGKPDGGFSLLVRVDGLGWKAEDAAQALLEKGALVTPMLGWGNDAEAQYIRIVYSNETLERLRGLGKIVRDALVKK